jgi:histidinol-phosphatase (PHP family)
MIVHDYHVHSSFSSDCQARMVDMCQAAAERGIAEIAFTEHLDLIPEDRTPGFFRPDVWWREVERCRRDFAGRLVIRAGVEIGEPHRFAAQIAPFLSGHAWDFYLGSVHFIGSRWVFGQETFKASAEVVYRDYFREVTRMVAEADIDVVAHADIVKRYGFEAYGAFDPRRCEAEIRRLLRICAERGLALEVNTATLRREVNQPSPDRLLLEWFREEGGRRLTLGSDAHVPEHVGFALDRMQRMVREAGFASLTCFDQRAPLSVGLASEAQAA